jgi:hypothetical protein
MARLQRKKRRLKGKRKERQKRQEAVQANTRREQSIVWKKLSTEKSPEKNIVWNTDYDWVAEAELMDDITTVAWKSYYLGEWKLDD